MQDSENQNPIINESADERRARELMKLLHKLRWIGEDDEAERLQSSLQPGNAGPCMLASPRETD